MDLSSAGYTNNQNQYNVHGSNDLVSILKRWQLGMVPGLEQQTNYNLGLEGHRENLLNQLFQNLTPASLKAAGDRQKNSIFQNSTRGAAHAAGAAAGAGFGDGAQGGLFAGAVKQGQSQASQVDSHYNDPSYLNQLYGQALGLVNQGMEPTFLQQLLQSNGQVGQQQQFNYDTRGQGLWGDVAPIAGAWAGGGFK